MPVVGCDSQNKKLIAEARYMCNIAKQQMYLAAARSKGKDEVTVTTSIRYILPLAVRMVELASR